MRGLFWALGVFAAAVALSLLLEDEGYVIVVAPPWRIEASLILSLVALLAAFAIIYLLARLISHTLRLPVHVRAFRARQREIGVHKATVGALQAMLEGRYGRVETLAADLWERGEEKAVAALLGARAAHRRRDRERRDEWLQRAEAEPEWRNARLALKAELLAEDRRFEEARAAVLELHANGLRHVATLSLLLRCEQALGNWDEVIHLATLLQKREAMPSEALDSIVTGARVAQIARLSNDAAGLAEYWRGMPSAERVRPRVAAEAARSFAQLGNHAAARRALEDALETQWDGELAALYADGSTNDALARIERAEQWLKQHPRDASLLLALGRLCMQAELWGKAESYLQASVAAQPSRDAHVALASLYSRIGRVEDADRHFRASADAALALTRLEEPPRVELRRA
jgi:HemY protein